MKRKKLKLRENELSNSSNLIFQENQNQNQSLKEQISKDRKILELQNQLEIVIQQLEDKEDKEEELQLQNAKLDNTLKSLNTFVEELRSQKEEKDLLLERAHIDIQRMKDDVEVKIDSNPLSDNDKNLESMSLWNEFSELEKKIQDNIQSNKPPKKEILGVKEEYFLLTAAAMKVRYALRFGDEQVFSINNSILYDRLCTQRIQYHEWHIWLLKQFAIELAQQRHAKNQNQSSTERKIPLTRNQSQLNLSPRKRAQSVAQKSKTLAQFPISKMRSKSSVRIGLDQPLDNNVNNFV